MEKKGSKKNKKCYKCKGKPQLFYKHELFICGKCYNNLALKKYKSFLRSKMDVYGIGSKIIAIFDGSLNSLMSCYLLSKKKENIKNPLKMQKTKETNKIIYIDFSSLENLYSFKKENYLQKVEDFFKVLNVDNEILKIEDFYNLENLKKNLDRIKSLGGYKEDYLKIIEDNIISKIILKEKPTHIIFPENSSQLATRSLKLLCKGRRSDIIKHCSPIYKKNKTTFGRPISDKSSKEVYFFNYYNKIIFFAFEKFSWLSNFFSKRDIRQPGGGSMNVLLADFVNELQNEHHCTSSTILKTIGRLKKNEIVNEEFCKCCGEKCFYFKKSDYCKGCYVIFEE